MKLLILFCFAICVCKGSNDVGLYGDLRSFVEDHGHYGYDHDDIIHPCEQNNLDCIRRFFAKNSHCTPRYGPVPDPFLIDHMEMPMPHANITFIEDNARVTGLNNVEIKKFYVNQATKQLVLQIEFKDFVLTTPTVTVRYHIEGHEPVELTDHFSIASKDVSMTMVMPITRHGIEMSKSHVYTIAAVNDAVLKYGPGIISKDPVLRSALDTLLLSRVNISLREGYVVKGPLYSRLFIESKVCSFAN